MGCVVMEREKTIAGCRTANSPEHPLPTLTGTSQTKASPLQPLFASSEGEQRSNMDPAPAAHQLTAAVRAGNKPP